MDYNSSRKKLILPEYGRNVHQMVDYALTIEDRKERMRCVNAIITIMGNLFPHLRDVSDFKHKLWDHLAIMADFKLDIDFPYDLPAAETFQTKPEKVPYNNKRIKYMHYGLIVEKMIAKACELTDEKERKQLTLLIAGHMKKSLIQWNKEIATDEKIIQDIADLSERQLILEPNTRIGEGRDNYVRNNNHSQGQNRNKRVMHKNDTRKRNNPRQISSK